MLRPDAFDWADDVEDQLAQDASDLETSESDERLVELLQPVTYVEAEQNDNAELAPEDNNPVEDDPPVFIVGIEPLIIDGSAPFHFMENQTHDFAPTRAQVNQEFAWRDYSTHIDPEIHHFNWLGNPVYERSQTPPAVSLLYLLSAQKIPQPGDELKWQSILSRATTYVDPVLVYLSGGWTDLQTKGEDLVRFATGRTFKFYSPHGRWTNDEGERTDTTTIDDGDVSAYTAPNLATGNGFAEICPIRSRMQWAAARDQGFAASRAFHTNLFRSRVRDRTYKSSPLRSSMVPGDVPSAASEKHQEERQAGQDEERELLDNVSDLPAIAPPQSRSVQGDSRSPLRGPLRRRYSSIDLRTTAEANETFSDSKECSLTVETFRSSAPSHRMDRSLLKSYPYQGSSPTAKPLTNSSVAPSSPSATTTSGPIHVESNPSHSTYPEVSYHSSTLNPAPEQDLTSPAAISHFSSNDSETSSNASTLAQSSDAVTLTSTPDTTNASDLNEDEGESVSKPFVKPRVSSRRRCLYEKVKNRVRSRSPPRGDRAKSKRMVLSRMVRKVVTGCSGLRRPWHVV